MGTTCALRWVASALITEDFMSTRRYFRTRKRFCVTTITRTPTFSTMRIWRSGCVVCVGEKRWFTRPPSCWTRGRVGAYCVEKSTVRRVEAILPEEPSEFGLGEFATGRNSGGGLGKGRICAREEHIWVDDRIPWRISGETLENKVP